MKVLKESCKYGAARQLTCRLVAATFPSRCTVTACRIKPGPLLNNPPFQTGCGLPPRCVTSRAATASETASGADAPESAPPGSAHVSHSQPSSTETPHSNDAGNGTTRSSDSSGAAFAARGGSDGNNKKKNRRGDGGSGSGSGPRARGSTPAATAAAAQAAADALFTDPAPGPLRAPRYGAVRITELGGGRGRGLVTTRTVQPGELLLAVRPLALAWDEPYDAVQVVQAPSSAAPLDPSDAKFLALQRQLLGRRYSTREAAWLDSLAGLPPPAEDEQEREGAGGSAGGPVRPLPPDPDLDGDLEGAAAGQEAEEAEAGGQGRRELPLPARLRYPDELADLVQANCLEPDGGAEDEHVYWARVEAAWGAEGLEGEEEPPRPQGVGPMGLWPEAAFLNHSCLPNTVAYVVGDTLFVRAARKVGSGAELTVSYLPVGGGADTTYGSADASQRPPQDDGAADGDDGGGRTTTVAGVSEPAATLLSPLEDRRAALEEDRGFLCRCPRCSAEEALDLRLRALMADVTSGVAALREDLEDALGLAALETDGDVQGGGVDAGDQDNDNDEAEEAQDERRRPAGWRSASSGPSASGRQRQGPQGQGQGRGRGEEEPEEGEEEGREGEDGGGGGRWRQLVGSVVDRAGMYVEVMDAAMGKLKLTPAQQMTVQSAVVPLYTVLWAALAARGELEPRLAEVVTALVGEVAPGSADHLWWAAVARETAEMIVAEEEALSESATVVRGSSSGGGGFKRQDERVTIADKACFKAYGIRYGPISRGVYRRLLEARRQREDMEEDEEEEGEESAGAA